ncbi:M24 family metallopeptidase [Periweissella ghanensis]|uniref:Aminopeptidase YpdF n=1 Tax=Periweissella ghanensis TaxID=467997 RepID=A0ABM8ZDA6_9LACO|nr:Xaa-Pro peptidase family protein [Periweissella ghanensis]MCM0600385.1 aminopeptidase P family protein [Periweissella ghanensis]CAH0419303.1 Aminopeptidase YpdF [Periweissella ghanensis]
MYQSRVTKLKKLLQMSELDGIIIANGDNMRYLSGFLGGNGDGLVVVSQAGLSVITDARYEEELGQLMDDDATLVITRNYYQAAADIIEKQDLQRVGFEDDLAFKIFDLLDELIVAEEFLPVPGIVEAMREIKDATELAALQRACDVSIAAFNAVLPKIKVGMTELEISNELDYEARKRGAQKASFDTIVASGWRGALPHGLASDKPIAAGELVTVDFGYFVDGYTSDITRTFAVGAVEPELEKIYTLVQTAQKLVIEAVFNGVPSSELDRIGRDYITQAGYGKEFNHGMGHGIGLAIHEGPNISRTLPDEMVTNNLLTIEPGIYVPNLGGVRIEDDIVVTETGYVNLTAALPTDLIHI